MELVLCATWAAPEAAEPQDALEVGEQHLDPFAVAARLPKGLGFAERYEQHRGRTYDGYMGRNVPLDKPGERRRRTVGRNAARAQLGSR